jgi:hypothetical protein
MMIHDSTYSVFESHTDAISHIDFWDNGIICIKLKPHVNIEIDDIKAQRLFLSQKFNGINKHLILVETSIQSSISKEAREFAAKLEINPVTKATAIITNSLADRIIINFIIKFSIKKNTKMKMFDSKQKAIAWLLSFNQY